MGIHDIVSEYLAKYQTIEELTREINALRHTIHQMSPFRAHPVDLVEWVPVGTVEANDYNPDSVALELNFAATTEAVA